MPKSASGPRAPYPIFANAQEFFAAQTLNDLLGMSHPELNMREADAMSASSSALADAIMHATDISGRSPVGSPENMALADRLITALMNKKNERNLPRHELGAPHIRPANEVGRSYKLDAYPEHIDQLLRADLRSLLGHPDVR